MQQRRVFKHLRHVHTPYIGFINDPVQLRHHEAMPLTFIDAE